MSIKNIKKKLLFVNDEHIGILEDVDSEDDILKGVDLTYIILEGVVVANDLLKTTYEKITHLMRSVVSDLGRIEMKRREMEGGTDMLGFLLKIGLKPNPLP